MKAEFDYEGLRAKLLPYSKILQEIVERGKNGVTMPAGKLYALQGTFDDNEDPIPLLMGQQTKMQIHSGFIKENRRLPFYVDKNTNVLTPEAMDYIRNMPADVPIVLLAGNDDRVYAAMIPHESLFSSLERIANTYKK